MQFCSPVTTGWGQFLFINSFNEGNIGKYKNGLPDLEETNLRCDFNVH